jgi:hypothetical protein
MEGGKVMHIDADFASGPIDDAFDNGLKTGLHELFSHGMGAGHRSDPGTLTYGEGVTGRIGNEKLSNSDRGIITNFIYQNKVNKGPTLSLGPLGQIKPNMSIVTFDIKGQPVYKTIGDIGFDIRVEDNNAAQKQK